MSMLSSSEVPTESELVAELVTLRDEGLPRLRTLELPALAGAARVVTLDDTSPGHVVIENLLRRAVIRFGGGQFGDGAVALFGLDAGTRGLNSRERREIAADAFGRRFETFRRKQEPLLMTELAGQILGLCAEQRTRDTRAALERAESPEASAMPRVWLERFAAYYRIWTVVNALGADLTAYRSTLLDAAKPYDRVIGTAGADDPGYSQDEQAEGYATFALFHYAHFAWLLRQFVTLYGGQWLLSDADAESAVAEAVYRIWWHSPWNERDDSYLRTGVAETPDQEMHGFLERLRSTELGRTTEQAWFEWASTCECSWTVGAGSEVEYFPTSQHHPQISDECQLHNVVRACGDYLDLIDRDWTRLADWYHVDERERRGVSAEALYVDLPADTFRSGTRRPRAS
jgi:hypothetical protein